MEGLVGIKLGLQLQLNFIAMEQVDTDTLNKIEHSLFEKVRCFSLFRLHIISLTQIEIFRFEILLGT